TLDGAGVRQSLVGKARAEAPDTARAEIAFSADDVVLVCVRASVSRAAVNAVLFGPGQQDADGAARALRQIADQTRGGGDDGDAGAVINGALPQIPRIQVRGEDDDLLRTLAATDLGEHVAGWRVLADVGFDDEVDAHAAAAGDEAR